MTTLTLKSQNEYMKPDGKDIFEVMVDWKPQTLFTWTKAMELFWDRIPTIDQLMEILKNTPWNCKETCKALNIPYAGYRNTGGGFDDAGREANLWSSSENDSDNAHYVYLNRDNDEAKRDWGDRRYAFSVRLLQDKFDSSSLWIFDEVILKLELLEKEKHMEADKISEAINLIRNLK